MQPKMALKLEILCLSLPNADNIISVCHHGHLNMVKVLYFKLLFIENLIFYEISNF